MNSVESRNQQYYENGYYGKFNDEDKPFEENHRGEEEQKNIDKSWKELKQSFLAKRRVVESQRSALPPTTSLESIKNPCQITHEVHFVENLRGFYSTRFSKTGEVIAAGFGSGSIQLRNGETGELEGTFKSHLENSIMCCRFNPVYSEIFYASSVSGIIFMCNTYTKEFSQFISELKNEVNAIDVNITGDYLVSGGKDAAIRLYNVKTTQLIQMYKKNEEALTESKATNFHQMRIFATRFHKEYPNLIITGGWDDTVRIWDIRVPGSVRIIKGPHICGDAIDMHKTYILTGSWIVRDSLQVWDLMSAKLIETINPYNRLPTLNGEFLYAVQYFDGDPFDGDLVLVGGSGINGVEMISLSENKIIGSFSASKSIFTIDSYQGAVTFGGLESVIKIGNYNFNENLL